MHRNLQIFSLLVDNEFGVLTRITALIRREGLNIKGLTVAETLTPSVSHLTVTVEMQGVKLETVVKRLGRLDCIRSFTVCTDAGFVRQELCLVVCTRESGLWQGQPILWEDATSVCFSCVGTPEALTAYLAENRAHLLRVSRSGVVTIQKGEGAHEAE